MSLDISKSNNYWMILFWKLFIYSILDTVDYAMDLSKHIHWIFYAKMVRSFTSAS